MLARRHCLARGISNGPHADSRFPDRTYPHEVQVRLHTISNHGGFSAYRMVFGADFVDLYIWEEHDNEPGFESVGASEGTAGHGAGSDVRRSGK